MPPQACTLCGQQFAPPPPPELVAHVISAHPTGRMGERPHACVDCGKRFYRAVDLRKHLHVHTGERPHACGECGKRFAQSSSLRLHMRTHTGERPYACDRCGKRFSDAGNMKRHLRKRTAACQGSEAPSPRKAAADICPKPNV